MNNKKLKVLRIITRMNVGGPSKHVVYLSDYLSKFNCETLLLSGKPDKIEGEMFQLAYNHNIELKIIKCLKRNISPVNDFLSLLQIIKIIKDFSPDIVHTHTTKAGILGRLAAVICKVPFIYHTYHGHIFKGYFPDFITTLIVGLERIFSKFSTKLITLTPNLAKEINSFLKLKSKDKIVSIPLGIELSQNITTTRKNNRWRKKNGFSENNFIIGIVSRLVPIKNHSLLINTIGNLCKTNPNLHLAIVGSGDLNEQLNKLVIKNNLENNVHFYGILDNLTDFYSDIDLFVLCSKNEGTPVAIIEALASGCPVASTKVGGVEELLEQGKLGRLLSLETNEFQKGLSKAIEDILNNSFIEYPTLEIREKIYNRYSVKKLVNNIYQLYSRCKI